jgi:hypothetical protein
MDKIVPANVGHPQPDAPEIDLPAWDAWIDLRRRVTAWRRSMRPTSESYDAFGLVLWMMSDYPRLGHDDPPAECSDGCGLAVDHAGRCQR